MKKTNPEIFRELISKPLLAWIKDNYKYNTQAKLAAALEISPSEMTRYIKGQRTMPGKLVDRLINLGFPQKIFSEYYARQFELATPENLDKNDLIKVLLQTQLLVNEWKELYMHHSHRVIKLHDEINEQNKTIRSLLQKIEKLTGK